MRIAVDTNVLIRAALGDDPAQSAAARDALRGAELVAISVQSLCEFAWVLGRSYRVPSSGVAAAIRQLVNARNVAMDRPAAEAGLAMLDAGGDFADAVIAFESARQGGETFVSFDRRAVKLLADAGRPARLLGA